MLTKSDIHNKLLAIAETQSPHYKERIAALHAIRKQYYDEHIAPLDAALAELEGEEKRLRDELRAQLLDHAQSGGALKPHPDIKIQKRTKWAYDAGEAFEWAKEHHPDCIRTKEELNKVAIKGHFDEFPGAELINVFTPVIPKHCYDLLVEEEFQNG